MRLRLRRARPALATAFALVTSGAVAVAPHVGAVPPPPGPTVRLAHALVAGEGFDICEAPPTSQLRAWLASPYRTVNIYFGGNQRACQPKNGNQRFLSAEWVRTATVNGWSLIPTYVGRQPPCNTGPKAKISRTPSIAQQQGHDAAVDAIDAMPTGLRALGIPRHSPAYVDIENFPAGHPTCDTAVRRFLLGWINEMRGRGYRAGVYGLPNDAIRVLVESRRANSAYPVPDAIWFARYDGDDSTRSADIPSGYLPTHRIHQYLANINRRYAGITLNIDKDVLRGDVVSPVNVAAPSGPPYTYAISGDPGTGVHIRTAPNTSAAVLFTKTDGDPITIECQSVGETVNGDYVWDKLATPDAEYVSDLFTNTTGGNGVSRAIRHCERTAPAVTVTPLPTTTLSSSVPVSYSATDASGILAYDVRWRMATDRSGFGAYHYPAAWQRTKARSQTLAGLAPGGTYCVAVRAYDRLTNRSKWSSDTCVARPLDDRALTAGSTWHRLSSSGFYLGTYTSTKTFRAATSRGGEQMFRVGVVATMCATCGKVRILVGGQSVGVIDLTAPSPKRRRTLLLDPFSSLRTGPVTVRVISSGKTVQLDGLVVSRR